MRILISGSSGLVGSAVVKQFRQQGYEIVTLKRSKSLKEGEIYWNPNKGELEPDLVEGFDAWINLAGENIAGRWSIKKKNQIVQSRLLTTETLAKTLNMLKRPPKVFINASAVGFYGNRGDAFLSEEAPVGKGFLAKVCRMWESAAEAVKQKGVRIVLVRFGTVLSPKGGALEKMVTPFKLGFGGVVGSGNQYMSWVEIDDLTEALDFILNNPNIQGPVNVVSPNPVTNKGFTKALGKMLHRPTLLPLPALAVRMLFGEMGEELLLSSIRVNPSKLLQAGFAFRYASIDSALQKCLVFK